MNHKNENLIYKIDIIKGLKIEYLTKALLSISDEFKRFTNRDKLLVIKEIRKGSGIIEFFEISIASSIFFIENANAIFQFIEYISDVKDVLMKKKYELPDNTSLTNETTSNMNSIFAPVINGDNNTVILNCGDCNVSLNSNEYKDIFKGQNKIKQLNQGINNHSELHKKVLFRWLQTRFDNSKSGNKGIISSIQDKPVKVIFENDASETKKEMTTSHSHVDWQKVGYIIDVETIVEYGNIVAYKVIKNYPNDCITALDNE
jgi:hypothetical protein